MAVFKCKMCGGALEIAEGQTVCECEYCGTRQTLPRLDGERKANLYDRANHFRRNNEFDKAAGIYDQILNEDPTDAEAYWSLVLCRYGVEYVEDPASHKRVPTVNRAQFTSIYADENYKQALARADTLQKTVYEAEAAAIDEIQRGILAISEKEEPFDVFICYKETDAQGRRTPDSVLATELYHELTKEGFKVFFSRITLEDKLGAAYEPYIFAALNSARVMVVLGTRPEYFSAVWVKNEWNRYLALVKQSGGKKTLTPAYRDTDPYDLPEEFSHLQAQDMSKLGFMPDLIRGIKKLLRRDEPKAAPMVQQVIQSAGGANLTAQIKRGQQALEDRDWSAADGFFDKALDLDAECAEAFFGKALAAAQCANGEELVQKRLAIPVTKTETLTACPKDAARIEKAVRELPLVGYLDYKAVRDCFSYDSREYNSRTFGWKDRIGQEPLYWEKDRLMGRAVRYARGGLAETLTALRERISEGLKQRLADSEAADAKAKAETSKRYDSEMDAAENRAKELRKTAEAKRKTDYDIACKAQANATTEDLFTSAALRFKREGLRGYEDSDERAKQCYAEAARLKAEAATEVERRRAELKAKAAAEKKAAEEKAERERIEAAKAAVAAKKKKTTKSIITVAVLVLVAAAFLIVTKVIIPSNQYKQAEALLATGNYDNAIDLFTSLGNYKNSPELLRKSFYARAEALLDAGDYDGAIANFKALGDYKDSTDRVLATKYAKADSLQAAGERVGAASEFWSLSGYSDARDRSMALWAEITTRKTIAGGENHTLSLRADGTVLAAGGNGNGQCDVSGWSNIIAIAAGGYHTVGLCADGTVLTVGNSTGPQCNVSDWSDVVAVAASSSHTVGLCADGTVLARGWNTNNQCDVSGWSDIVMVAVGSSHTVGLHADGTVVAVGNNGNGQCDVSDWSDIVAVAAGSYHTVGLRTDGTVVATGSNGNDQCEVSGWSNIVEIAAGARHTVGLCSDGTVVAVGSNSFHQCEVSDWSDVVDVAAGFWHTIGLCTDGTVLAAGENDEGQCDVSGWTDIMLPNR